MTGTRKSTPAMAWGGLGLLITGLVLACLLCIFEVPLAGLGAFSVAILLGIGLSVLILAVLSWVVTISTLSPTSTDATSESEENKSSVRVYRAKLAIYFTAFATLMALVLSLAGVPIAFIGFNFATGTNAMGLIVILTGLVVGVVAISSSLVAIILGWIAANTSRNFRWLIAALAMPIFQLVAYFVGTYFISTM